MKKEKHACVWCEKEFLSLEHLIGHAMFAHAGEWEQVGPKEHKFKVYNHAGHKRILCLCGKRFTCNQINPAPLFEEWAVDNYIEIDSFVAHLRREGGLKNHLQKLRDEAMMAKIAGCVDG